MKAPCSEFKIQNTYWKTSEVSPTARIPKTHVRPRRVQHETAIRTCVVTLASPLPLTLFLPLLSELLESETTTIAKIIALMKMTMVTGTTKPYINDEPVTIQLKKNGLKVYSN